MNSDTVAIQECSVLMLNDGRDTNNRTDVSKDLPNVYIKRFTNGILQSTVEKDENNTYPLTMIGKENDSDSCWTQISSHTPYSIICSSRRYFRAPSLIEYSYLINSRPFCEQCVSFQGSKFW